MTNLHPAHGLRVAIVHHWFIRRGGAERVVEELAALFPQAEIFTLLADDRAIAAGLAGRQIHTSYLQRWPGSRRFHRLFMPLFPMALESLDLSAFDLVISSESGPSKGVLTRADACHICYCHSPMRYVWEMPHHYRGTAPGGRLGRGIFNLASHYMRLWDYATAARVDHFVASSANGANRIRKVYRRSSTVIHPPVDLSRFSFDPQGRPGDYYLAVSRLVSYKRLDLAIAACNQLGRRLIVIGAGEQRASLQRMAGPTIEFKSGVSDEEVGRHLRQCRAFLFPGEEDIGLTPIEAQACGRPVIAYGRGGALETVRPLWPQSPVAAATGVFFDNPDVDSLAAAMLRFEQVESEWSPADIRAHALRFDVTRFRREFATFVEEQLGTPRACAAEA